MRALPAVVFLCVVLSACAGVQPLVGQQARTAQQLVGVWCNSTDGGATCWAYDEFRRNGTFEACGQTEDDPRPFFGEGTYTLVESRMCYTVTRSSPNFWLGTGARYCTEILSISPTSHRYRDLDTGAVFELSRVPVSSKQCRATP